MAEPFDPETVRTALALYDSPPKSPWTAHEGHLVGLVAHWHDCGALPHLRALLAAHDAHGGEVEALREIVATLERHVGERDARLREVRDFLEDQFDVEDGDEGDVLPNWAMRAVNIIDRPWAAFQAERRTKP